MIFIKNFKFKKKKIHYVLFDWFFKYYYCSINLKRQSEPSGLRPDTSSLVHIHNRSDLNWSQLSDHKNSTRFLLLTFDIVITKFTNYQRFHE